MARPHLSGTMTSSITMQSRFLDCIRAELPYRDTTGFRYEVLTDDPAIRKAADDILLDLFGEEDSYTLSEYTQKMGGI